MAKRQRRGLTKKSKTRSKLPTDPELIEKGIMWWRRTFPKCQLRPSWPVSAVMRGRRLNEWGERDQRGRLTKDEGRYVLLRSHDGGQALPLHELTVCGLFRWHGRRLVPVFVLDGHADFFVDPEDRKAALAHDRKRRPRPLGFLAIYAGSSGHPDAD